ncbi:MAG: cadmium-translocating P-type ATPase [Clostridia bacterium]|nr:cadmium-translocating P-type ATPase [Clostridia bacterium]
MDTCQEKQNHHEVLHQEHLHCACDQKHCHEPHEHGETCGCGHKHHHEHEAYDEACGCEHKHQHEPHEHGETCGCGHKHHHEHHEHGCGCGHDHGFEIDCGCGCGHDHGHGSDRKTLVIRLALTVVLTVLALVLHLPGWLSVLIHVAAYVIIGCDILLRSFKNIRRGQIFDENFLMSIASAGAMCLGEFVEGTAVLALYQLGEMFQDMAVDKSRRSISELMDIRPDHADVEMDGRLVRMAPDQVAVGSVIVVKAGDKIPLDGEVLSGNSTLDTAALTGESMPRDIGAGDPVISGCVNLSGELRVRTTKAYQDSTVSRILQMVQHASANKSRPEQFITRFARVYTPVVVFLAALLALVPPLFTGFDFALWVERALTFLVISCPCALVISVPLTFFSGIGGASRKGVLVKGAVYMEKLSRISMAVFDKTGTLTCGEFNVTHVVPNGVEKQELMQLAAAVERSSNHPIARSVCAACGEERTVMAQDVKEIAGCGLSGVVNGHRIAVGNEKMMALSGVQETLPIIAGTAVHVSRDGQYIGAILVSDQLKDHAAEALLALKCLGIKKNVILSGDRKQAAEQVGRLLAADEVRAELLPDDKVKEVEKLLHQEKQDEMLAYVGDGINDAPVLARADVGIAMGALGSDAAIEAADVVIMDDDPMKIPLAVRIARGTMRIGRQNIIFALGVKVLVMLLGAMGFASMWMAVFADVGVCLLAVANAMRAMKIR